MRPGRIDEDARFRAHKQHLETHYDQSIQTCLEIAWNTHIHNLQYEHHQAWILWLFKLASLPAL